MAGGKRAPKRKSEPFQNCPAIECELGFAVLTVNAIVRDAAHIKALPVTGCGGLQGCEVSKITHFLDIQLTDGSEVVSLIPQLCFTSQKDFLLHISIRGLANARALL
jgi:hypothetical protein